MKTNVKSKLSRIIVALALLIATIATTVQPAFAAGTETWSAWQGYVGEMRVKDSATTYVKTMGHTGTIRLSIHFYRCNGNESCNRSDKEPTSYPPVRVTCDIYTTSGEFLGSGYMDETLSLDFNVVTNRVLNAGEQIYMVFDVSTQPGYTAPGPYRKAHIQYWYSFQ